MTNRQLEFIKWALRSKDEAAQQLWFENQLLRNLIIDSQWMTERELDLRIQGGKADPENLRQFQEHFAAHEDANARIGLADWLAAFDSLFPPSDQSSQKPTE